MEMLRRLSVGIWFVIGLGVYLMLLGLVVGSFPRGLMSSPLTVAYPLLLSGSALCFGILRVRLFFHE
jgi:hypothetical protein